MLAVFRWTTLLPLARALAVAALAALPACAVIEQPDLGELYNRAAQTSDRDRNPILVIPGILGSKLVTRDSDRLVWGSFIGSFANPQKPEGARLMALPMAEGVPLRDLRDDIVPGGVLDSITVSLLGMPVELGAYVHILRTLGVGGYKDQSLGESGSIDYGDDHFTCFQFAYDWRRDIVESAKRLHEYVLDRRAFVKRQFAERYGLKDPVIKFDLVAHSMGGLVTRYYLRYGTQDLPADGSLPKLTWEGARYVERAVLIGTPNAGSLQSLIQLVEGADFAPIVPDYPAAVLGTMPSIYQLLPRGRHGAVVEAWDPEVKIPDYMEPAFWENAGWGLADPDQDPLLRVLLPDVADAAERRRIALDHQAKLLKRARQFMRAMDRPASPPDGLSLHLIAADSLPTDAVVAVDRDSGEMTVFDKEPGDGTVLRASALMDERQGVEWSPKVKTPIDWESVLFLFDDHLGMTRNPIFTDNILYFLLEAS